MGTRWWYRVRAEGSFGDSAASAADDATLDDVMLSPPGDLTAGPTSPTQVSVDLVDPLDAPGGHAFTIERAPDAGGSPGTFVAVATGVTSFPHVLAGHSPGTAYHFRAKATKAGIADSPYSRERAAVALVDRPQSVTATHDTAGCFETPVAYRVDLTWNNLNSAGDARNDVGTEWEYRVTVGGSWTSAGSFSAAATAGTISVANGTTHVRGRYVGGGTAWVEKTVLVDCPE